jgi:hypothetical protein
MSNSLNDQGDRDTELGKSQDRIADTRSPMAKALHRVTQITTMSLSFAIPIAAGNYLDSYLDTGLTFTLILFVFGALAAAVQLRKLIRDLEQASEES